MLPFLAFATSVSISTEVLTHNEASNFGINRLVSGNQGNWIVLLYPHQSVARVVLVTYRSAGLKRF